MQMWMRSRPGMIPFPPDLPTSFLSRNFRLRGAEFNRAHIVVTCNRRSFVSEFIHVRSIQDRTAEESWEVKMRRSSLVALLSLLLVASASPSFARTTGTEARLGPQRTTTAERMAPAMPRTDRAAAPRPRPKTCNYRGGPKTGIWSCE